MDRASPKGDPVSRRKAAKYRKERQKKAAKKGGQGERREGVGGGEHEEKAGSSANRFLGITNVATSLAKMAELKEAEQQAGKRQKKIEALKLKLTLGLVDAYFAHLK